ncbi:trehalose-6-phosphate synthase [Ramlibacter albus]|uniref:Trehalose-6-phosphate synthase n=1 Tax=Ramlibacter albus TaxID=2079448 RepID=A0A923MDQ0_9BURK|nr:trehalose-6-phosphate synthase [Ramlibacter albus]MBC5767147.1 trehalose-6-phosphate synthase [Ramlibacter albus]
MKTYRLQLRFLLPLVATLIAAAWLAAPVFDKLTLRWFSRDLTSRGILVANALSDSVADAVLYDRVQRLKPLFNRAVEDERLFAVGVCSPSGALLTKTDRYPATLDCERAAEVAQEAQPHLALEGGSVHVAVRDVLDRRPRTPGTGAEFGLPLPQLPPAEEPATTSEPLVLARIVLLHDLSFIERRSQDTRRYLIGMIAALGLVISFITVVVAQLSWRGWVNGARALMRGEVLLAPITSSPELAPLAADLRGRLRDLEDEYRRSQGPETEWNAGRLRQLLKTQLSGDQVIVVSNREPYIHEKTETGIVVKRPASGLVTAVEPVMRACSGTWIAHGSGSADRDVVDAADRVAVPPGHDDYWLRRIWLTPEEEQGYYYGFANEGLWPLCHVAHVRPVFRESDWQAYKEVNRRFADAVVAEARGDDPVVLVQDYHFALLPALIREKLPRATILTFWHIPWPNPESFGICPWRREILQGMLGSTILGFHTRYHCKNFIETVDRYLEARIEHEHSTISYREKDTLVESYPISIEWPREDESMPPVAQCRANVVARLALPQQACIAVGIDRFDYTKGILERMNAVERFLEKHPEWVGRFVLVQVAAPTRAALDEYRNFSLRVQELADRINARFGNGTYAPIVLLAKHHEHDAVMELFRAADICLVTSLHDGMNLVCKEFVAARDDQQGVLILSRFAGAAREMPEALIVNPYHVEETADALHRAAVMPPAEQRERMASLRSTVREFNVFRWAGRMLADAGRWRLRARIEERVRRLGAS